MKACVNFEIDFTSTVGHRQTARALRALADTLDPIAEPKQADGPAMIVSLGAGKALPIDVAAAAGQRIMDAIDKALPPRQTPTEALVPTTSAAPAAPAAQDQTMAHAASHGDAATYKAGAEAVGVIQQAISVNDLIALATRLVAHPKAGGPRAMLGVLAQHGVQALHNGPPNGTAKPEQYGAIKADIERLLAQADVSE